MSVLISIFILITMWNLFMSFFNKGTNILYCGMVGYSGPSNFNADKIAQLLLANMTRGVHSTGVWNDGKIIKIASDAIDFLAKNKLVPQHVFMGHDRHATVGAKDNVKNAHPFKFGTIVGQHNGTLKNHWDLCRAHGLKFSDYDVDSQILIELINKEKEKLTVLEQFEGAAAVIWVDLENPDTLFCFRNSERPLFRGMLGRNMYISSIAQSLDMIGCTNVQTFEERKVYEIKSGKIVSETSKPYKRLEEPKKSFAQNRALPLGGGDGGFNKPKYPSHDVSGSNAAQLDRKCHFVRCLVARGNSSFEVGNYYQVHNEVEGKYVIEEPENVRILEPKKYFTEIENLKAGDYVITMREDNKYFKRGEILFLRGLELSPDKQYTVAVLEKPSDDNVSYTWSSKNIRNATEKERNEFLVNEKTLLRESEDEALSQEEVEMYQFENDPLNKDKNGNRLGDFWIGVEGTYETFMSLRQGLDLLSEDIEEKTVTGSLSNAMRTTLYDIKESIDSLYDMTETELNSMFDRLYETYYKNPKKLAEDGSKKKNG